MAGWRSELAGCRSALSMSKIKVRISETKFRSFYKTLVGSLYKIMQVQNRVKWLNGVKRPRPLRLIGLDKRQIVDWYINTCKVRLNTNFVVDKCPFFADAYSEWADENDMPAWDFAPWGRRNHCYLIGNNVIWDLFNEN